MSEINTDGIKQEMREDVKDIIDNLEDEYDDDDIQIDDSDVSDFLTEEEDNDLMDSSDNFTDSSLNETVPKTEPFDASDFFSTYQSDGNATSDIGNKLSTSSEQLDEVKTEENHSAYSYDTLTSAQYSNYYPQSSYGYQEPAPPAQVYSGIIYYQQPQAGYQQPSHVVAASNYPSNEEWKPEIKPDSLYSIDNLEDSVGIQKMNLNESSADGWMVDNTVPLGWKHKTSPGNNKTMVYSPSGHKFDSRKNALKYMKANNYPAEQIAIMNDCMKYEGWKVDEYLPEGWKYRQNKNQATEFMTSEEKVLNSTSGASREIGNSYPQEIFNRFNLFSQKMSKRRGPTHGRASQLKQGRPPVRTQTMSFPPIMQQTTTSSMPVRPAEWTADHTIPAGWRMSNSNGKFILLSPNGLQFDSRRAAFQEMVTKNYPDQMKADVFDKLAFEGFQANELLPFGWIYQKTEGELNFLNREGRLLSSFRQAFEFLRSNKDFTSEEAQRFQTFHKLMAASVPKPVVVWKENDQTVPIGWKTKPAGNGNQNQKLFLSPNGYELKSRRMALKHMIEFGYSEEAAEEMRKFLYYEGWMEDQTLPYLWKMKKNGGNLLFVSQEGDLLESSKVAISYIQKNPYSYSQEDVQRIEYVSSMVQKTALTNRAQGQIRNQTQGHDKRKSLGQLPSQIVVKKVDTSYVADGSVPKGWKVKTDAQRPSYMAPNGSTYKSRRVAYRAMIQERYPNEEIEAMRKTLKYDGWLDNSELPEGWKVKQMGNNTYLMDRGGELFKSYIEAAKFIESYIQYFTQEDLDKINRLAKINQPTKSSSRSILTAWVENDITVPRGWKSKSRNVKKGKSLMSPDGVVFNSRKAALEIMVKSGASNEQVEEIKTSLTHEGWKRMDVPIGWMYKPLTAYGYHFLSEQGIHLESKGKAMEHLMKNGLLNEENKKNIDMIRGVNKVGDGSSLTRSYVRREHIPQQITPDASWSLGDDTVPEGWRVKEYEHNGKSFKMILSPAGLSFRNRRSALSYMIKNTFPPEEIDEIRRGLVHDGWKEDPLLPTNWRFKPKRPVLYCSDEGEILQANINAIRKVQSSEKYTTQQVENLKQFTEKHGGTRNQYVSRNSGSLTKIFENAVNKEELVKTLDGLGWMQNKYLPTDWLFQEKREGNMHIDVLSSEGKRFISYKQAVAFMRSIEKYTEKDVEKFYLFPDGKTRSIRMTESRLTDSGPKTRNETASNDWVENDETVPVGWKSKLWVGSSSKKCLLSPEGNVYKSRLGAYKYLIKYGSEEQIEEMRKLLVCDGWKQYPLLPAGWMYKKKECNNQYLTEGGEKLAGNNVALKHFKENEKYANKLEDLYRFFAELKTYNFSSALNESYHKSSITGNLRWLVQSGAEEEQINKARVECMEAGWKANKYLPENWLHKPKAGNHPFNILTAEGLKFISYKSAIQFMRTNNKYTEADIQQLRLFPEGKPSGRTNRSIDQPKVALDDPNWKEDDDTVPKGWKSMKMEGKDVTMLQTPDGVVYWSRRAALKNLLSIGASTEQIDEIKISLAHDGWKTYENLPKGWMFKRKEARSIYLTDSGELVDGHSKAQKFIAENEKYSVEDQTNIRNFVLQTCQIDKPSVKGSPNIGRPKTVVGSPNIDQPKTVVGSPNIGRPKTSLIETLQNKLRNGTTEEKDRAKEELEAKGWNENEYLPEGWMYKEYKSSSILNVLSSEGQVYHSYKSVLQKLDSDEKYISEDYERFKRFPDGKLHKVEINKSTLDKVKKEKHYSLKQYQEALKKENNEEEIEEIKAYYIQKGWIEDETILPAMWLFRQKTGLTSLNFLTSSGELLLSTKEANKYLDSHGVKQVIEVQKCKARCGTNYELELKKIEKKVKLEANVKIPSGIKIEAAVKNIKEEEKPKANKVAPDVSSFKFYSLEEFDSKNNVGLQEFKGVFEKLESFKKTIKQEVKTELFDDFDLL